ncbi:MAG: dTDP-4-amino-4,6-dideoxyglucose formyltransferase [Gammaproteobacteria bacterium]|nr:dTDP-4-amino-4,6-dideoxyglucose formyltransferase [Gammaproteobacteria bacterium]
MSDNKKILVVSDNSSLVSFFQNECLIQEVSESHSIEYRYSTVNEKPQEMIQLGATSLDVKDLRFITLAKNKYDLIVSIHCKQIFPADLVSSVTCINVHPGLNPYNRGWYPQVFSIINGKPIGATIHLMDEEVDHGGIIDQLKVDIRLSDTSLDVYEKVVEAEKLLIRKNLLRIIKGEFSVAAPESEGNYNSIGDFKSLCKLNINAKATLKDHIDLLRALTHGEFKNAYFLDEHGSKIYIRVTLEE